MKNFIINNDNDDNDLDELCPPCVNITPDQGEVQICNITECWSPMLKMHEGLLIIYFPLGIAVTISLHGLYFLMPILNREFMRNFRYIRFEGSTHLFRCIGKILADMWKVFVLFMKVYFLTIFMILFDVFDVYMDLSMGYRLGMGEVIDRHIYRNEWVIYFIFVFAFLGVLKIAICLHLLRNTGDDMTLFKAKTFCYCVGFLLEDCGEMFLEYFYIENYLTKSGDTPWFLLTRNAIYCLISIRLLFWRLYEMCTNCCSKEFNCTEIMFFGAPVIIGIVSLLRTSTAVVQALTGELKPLCLEVVDGRLIQTPFRESCMKPINYLIVILIFTPLLLFPAGFAYYIKNNHTEDDPYEGVRFLRRLREEVGRHSIRRSRQFASLPLQLLQSPNINCFYTP